MAKIWPMATHTSPRVRPSGDGLSCDIGGVRVVSRSEEFEAREREREKEVVIHSYKSSCERKEEASFQTTSEVYESYFVHLWIIPLSLKHFLIVVVILRRVGEYN
jgi:hypothetical protein